MSNMVAFCIYDNMNYESMNSLSRHLIKYSLDKNIGVIFNFLGYGEDIIREANPMFYFSVSDDFIQLNSEFLSTQDLVENIETKQGKIEFCKRFYMFDEIFNILLNHELNNIKLIIITDGSTNSLNECEKVEKNDNTISEILYDSIIRNHTIFAYDFPNIVIECDSVTLAVSNKNLLK